VSELCDLTATELAGKLRARETSAAEIVQSSLARIEAVDGRVQAFLTPTPDLARERAKALDELPRAEISARRRRASRSR